MAPGFQLGDESHPIAKGLTSKTDKLLSKICLGPMEPLIPKPIHEENDSL